MIKQANQYTSEIQLVIDSVTDWEKETDRVARLINPLAEHLIECSYQWDCAGIPKKGRIINLAARDWPKQYEANIKRCVGFGIRWQGGW